MLYAQEQKMKTIYGNVNARNTFEYLSGVSVISKDSSFSTLTDEMGSYSLTVTRKTKRIFFHHEDYHSVNIKLRLYTRKLDVRMKKNSPEREKYGELSKKNALSVLPLKLILGALGLRYERFIKQKYSAGLYFDWYFRGRQYFGDEEYTGFKATPTFRYFFMHHNAMGFYLQASAIIGYFDFSVLNYVHPSDHEDEYPVEYYFWTGGAGAAIGAYFALGKARQSFIDMNIGWQIMPANYPYTMETPNGTYEHYNGWWYLGGPGSIIEIKIALGGIF